MIDIKNLKIKVGEKEIISGMNIAFEAGKNYLVLGKNGSGKSSLANYLMGNPVYEYISGEANIEGIDINSLTPNERSQVGLFLSFQNVPEIEGINLGEYLRIIYNNYLENKAVGTKEKISLPKLSPFVFKRFIKKNLEELQISESFLSRDLNVGFSGGEKRKIELLQAKLLQPKYIILDEIDSGLDIDAFKVVLDLIAKLKTQNNSLIIITHQFKILEYLKFDTVYILRNGKVEKSGGVELVDEIIQKGFQEKSQ